MYTFYNQNEAVAPVETQDVLNRIIRSAVQTNSRLVNPFGSSRKKTPLPKLVQPQRRSPEEVRTDIETDEETNYRSVIEVIGSPGKFVKILELILALV